MKRRKHDGKVGVFKNLFNHIGVCCPFLRLRRKGAFKHSYDPPLSPAPYTNREMAQKLETVGIHIPEEYIEKMYTDFLAGISAISQKEFEITDIAEDTSQLNWEEGTGIQKISFQYNGHPYTYEGQAYYDWMDCRIFDFMNNVFEEEGNPKRLLFTGDGGQGYIVFYNTPKWGRELEKATGLKVESQYEGGYSAF